jgi:hypothetical protein
MDLKAVLLSSLLSLFLVYFLGFFAYLRFGKPHIEAFLNEYQKMIKATRVGMSAMSEKGAESRTNKAITKDLEQDLFQGLIDSNPELIAIAEELFPDFLEGLRENPQQGLALLKRYIPLLQSLGLLGSKAQTKETEYNF